MIRIILIAIGLFILQSGFSNGATRIGEKREFRDTSDVEAPQEPTVRSSTLRLGRGQQIKFGPLKSQDDAGSFYHFCWTSAHGELVSHNAIHSEVTYTAPSSGVAEDDLAVWIASESGKTYEARITVLVQNAAVPNTGYEAPVPGQISASYDAVSAQFSVTYSLGATVTKAWILASTNGVNYSQVTSIDPVTSANRAGTRLVTVSGSNAVSKVYIKVRTQVGTAAPTEGGTVTVAYVATPASPKSTEIPTAPDLIINGNETSNTQVEMFWARVNDSLNRDNVNYYEVQYAPNPAFTGAATLNAGNNAPGQNMYERASYTATNLADDTTYYFRVRGVNNAGTGPWSNVDSILINIQDRPVFDPSPVLPANGSSGISKLPALEFRCTDPDDDPLDYYIYCGTSPTQMYRVRGFHDPQWEGNQRLDPSEWGSQLQPGTRYYWRVEVREDGRDKAFYGGEYPSSPTWEFVTESTGSNLTFSNVTLLSGTIQPEAQLTYRLTVTNNGNQPSLENYLKVAYVKNGAESLFVSAPVTPPVFPALNPGQSTTTDVSFRFRNELWTSPSGVVHDNILIVGSSAIRFFFQDSIQNLGAVSYTLPITYANAGGPVFNSFFLDGGLSGGNRGGVPRGGTMQISASIRDDVRTTRTLIEYRLNPQSPWTFLDDYTGNTTQYMRFGQSSHSGPTVSSTTNGSTITWTVPANFPLTSILEMRITAYDDQGTVSFGISPGFAIYDDTLIVTAGSVDAPAYRLGESSRIPVSVATTMVIGYYKVTYRRSPGGDSQDILTVTGNGLTSLIVPPVLTVQLPISPYKASETGILEVTVGASAGYGGRNVTDASDNTFALRIGDLPAPFHTPIAIPLSGGFSFPQGSTSQSTWVVGKAADWEGEAALHVVAEEGHSYTLAGVPYNPDPIRYWLRFDRANQTFTQAAIPTGFDISEVKVIGATPYILLQRGNEAHLTWKSGSAFVTPQLIESHALLYGDEHGLVKRGANELYYSFTVNRNQSSSLRRNRLRRIVPSVGTTIEHPGIWHGYYPCYGTHFSGTDGIYNLNSDLTLGASVATWTPPPYYTFRFTNTSGPVVGARLLEDAGSVWLQTYDQSGLPSRWSTPFERANLKSLTPFSICVGTTPSGRPDSEGQMVVRRQHSGGSEQSVLVGNRPGNNDGYKQSAISDGGLVAVMWSTLTGYFAIGNMSGDITAPAVEITTADGTYVTGQSKALAWTMSDNQNQLASVKVLKIVGGVSTQIANYTSGTLPTSLNHTFNDTTASVIVRVETYDQSGNRGVAEKVLMRSSTFTFSGFTAASYSVAMGTGAQLNWTATPVDAFRVYNILTRPQGGTAWTTTASVTGSAHLLDTSLLSGTVEVRVESAGTMRDLPQTLTITGNRFAFDNAGFSPASGTVYVGSSNSALRLNWASNQAESPAIPYTVLGRFATSGPGSTFAILGVTTTKTLEVNTGSNTLLEWRVVANWEGQEFVSGSRSVAIAQVAAPAAPSVNAGGRNMPAPWVDISWPAVAGVDGYMLYRKNLHTDTVEELTRVSGTSYRDEAVTWGNSFSYTLSTVLGEDVSLPGAASSVTVSPLLPLGVTFVNASYQIVPDNANTVSWNPSLPAGVTAVYEEYLVHLRRSDGVVVASDTVVPEANNPARVIYTALEYNQSYAVEVFALHPDGSRLNTEPVRLHFSTGFDTRPIPAAPAVATPVVDFFGVNLTWTAVANADYYDIFRRNGGGALVWVGRSSGIEFADMTAPTSSSITYLVRARNSNTYTDSVQSVAIVREEFRITSIVRTGAEGQDIVLTFSGYPGAIYRVQQSSTLAPDSWTDTGISAPGTGSAQSLTVPAAITSSSPIRHFFRVVAE